MTTSFAGIDFEIETDDGYQPMPEPRSYYSVEHYPETNTDEVQLGGLGDNLLTVKCYSNSDADVAALQSLVQTSGQLLAFGNTYNDAVLLEMRNKRRRTYAQEWEFEMVFDVGAG